MKKLKKLMAFVITAAMCMAMAVPAMADDPAPAASEVPTNGTITVNPNFKDQTYKLYKLFDAHITFNADGTAARAITYTIPGVENADTDDLGAGSEWFEVNDQHFVVAKDGTNTDWAKDPDAIAWAKEFGTEQFGSAITAASDNDPNVKWENVPFGYYFVETTLGSFIGVNSNTPNVTIQDKNQRPTIDKEIVSIANATDTLSASTDTTDPGNGVREKGIAQIGDEVKFKLTIAAKPGAQSYTVVDVLPAGLTAPAENDVTVSEATRNTDYQLSVDDQTITVIFLKDYLDTIDENTSITIEYTAIVNNSAVIGEAGNTNTATLTWGPASLADKNKSEDSAVIYTGQIEILKQDDSQQPLAGAGFVLKKGELYYKLYEGSVSWVARSEADEHFSGADGKVPAFTGLKNGEYTLEEKTVPAGYNKLDDKTVTIAATTYTDANLKQSATVTNNAGAVLPSTGGMGTTIFYVVGAILVIGAGVLLVVRRRMREE